MASENQQAQPDFPATSATVRDLIAVCGSLTHVMSRETALLRAMRTSEIRDLQENKVTLALSYGQQVEQLADDPVRLRAVAPILRDELKRAMGRLQVVGQDNETALRACREANARVIHAIADAVAENQHDGTPYGPDGTCGPGTGEKPSVCLSIDQES